METGVAICSPTYTAVPIPWPGTRIAGFVAVKTHADSKMGEISMIATDPECQRRGVTTVLMSQSMDWMKKAGLAVAMVETGAYPGHAPARRVYERAGFRLFPVAR